MRPSSKRNKARNKRALDPNRHAYKDLLEKSGHLIDTDARSFHAEDSRQASEDEAAAVAAAIGYKPLGGSPLVQSQTVPVNLDQTIADQDLKSPGVVMKSPELRNLDSPEISDSSSSDEEDDGGISTGTSGLGLGGEKKSSSDRSELVSEEPPKMMLEAAEAEGSETGSEVKDADLRTADSDVTEAALNPDELPKTGQST